MKEDLKETSKLGFLIFQAKAKDAQSAEKLPAGQNTMMFMPRLIICPHSLKGTLSILDENLYIEHCGIGIC